MWFAIYIDHMFDINPIMPNEQRVARFSDVKDVDDLIRSEPLGYCQHMPLSLYVSNRTPRKVLLVFEMLRARHNPNYSKILRIQAAGYSNLPFENQVSKEYRGKVRNLASNLYTIRTLAGSVVWRWSKLLANTMEAHISYNSSLAIYLLYLSTVDMLTTDITKLLMLNLPPRYLKFTKKSMIEFKPKRHVEILSYRERLYSIGVLRFEKIDQDQGSKLRIS